MMDSGRKTAFQILFEVEKEKAFSNLTANRIIKDNNPENPAFVRELVYGVLENKMLLDYYIDMLVPSGIGKVKDREKTILRMGIYQIKFMDSVPDYGKEACKGQRGLHQRSSQKLCREERANEAA